MLTERMSTPDALARTAEGLLYRGDLRAARDAAVRALEAGVAARDHAAIARSHLVRAECEMHENGPEAAQVYLAKALPLAKDPSLELFARLIGARIEIAFARSGARRDVLPMVAAVLAEGADLDRTLQSTLDLMARASGASSGTIALSDEKGEFRFAASLGDPPSLSAIRRVLDRDEPLRIANCGSDAWARDQESIRAYSVSSMLVVPLRHRNHRAGVVYLDRRGSLPPFEDADLQAVSTFASYVSAFLVRVAEAEADAQRANRLERVVESGLQDLRRRAGFGRILGRSLSMQRLYDLLAKVANLSYPVVIEGETGSGKELAARAIHFESARKDQPFLAVNCGGLAETVLESELFGHVKGAFTGAVGNRAGVFEAAGAGTLFLDEIEEMSESMQVKLLRVLEDAKVRPVGSTKDLPVEARIVAASNVPLRDLVKQGKFREDLYYRLSSLQISLPPLRERADDLPLLAEHFLREIAAETNTPPKRLSETAMKRMVAYDWPGNIRELKNVLRRMVLVSGEEIGEDDLPAALRPATVTSVPGSFRHRIEMAEKEIILRALRECGGNVRRTARELRMSRNTLMRKLDRYRLTTDLD